MSTLIAPCRVACYVATCHGSILGATSVEPEPAWPHAAALALVHAVPYLFRCRAVLLSCAWVFGRVSWAWLAAVRRLCLAAPADLIPSTDRAKHAVGVLAIVEQGCWLASPPAFCPCKNVMAVM